jgi:hypothetical protein
MSCLKIRHIWEQQSRGGGYGGRSVSGSKRWALWLFTRVDCRWSRSGEIIEYIRYLPCLSMSIFTTQTLYAFCWFLLFGSYYTRHCSIPLPGLLSLSLFLSLGLSLSFFFSLSLSVCLSLSFFFSLSLSISLSLSLSLSLMTSGHIDTICMNACVYVSVYTVTSYMLSTPVYFPSVYCSCGVQQ